MGSEIGACFLRTLGSEADKRKRRFRSNHRLHAARGSFREHQRLWQNDIRKADRSVGAEEECGGAARNGELAGGRRDNRAVDPVLGQKWEPLATKLGLERSLALQRQIGPLVDKR